MTTEAAAATTTKNTEKWGWNEVCKVTEKTHGMNKKSILSKQLNTVRHILEKWI